MEKNEARLIAAAAGLAKLEEKHLAQVANAMASARELAAKLPTDLHWIEEFIPVFRPTPGEGKP